MFKNCILLIVSIIPVFILLKFAFDKDKIEKEPLSLLFKLFIAGILSSIIVLLVSKSLMMLIHTNNNFYRSFIEMAFIEEVCKWITVYIITWRNKEFNYKFDATIYCIFVSLGFAFIENLGYSFNYGLSAALLRAIISVPCHCFFAIYMGYYLGIAKMYYSCNRRKKGSLYSIYSILIPTAIHGIYNFCLVEQNGLLYIIFIMFIIILYFSSFKTINLSSNLDMAFNKK